MNWVFEMYTGLLIHSDGMYSFWDFDIVIVLPPHPMLHITVIRSLRDAGLISAYLNIISYE